VIFPKNFGQPQLSVITHGEGGSSVWAHRLYT